MEYTKFLSLARKYRTGQTDSEHLFLELLVAQEEQVLDWRKPKSQYDTWSELLQGEGFCTITTYRNYKKARQLIERSWIRRLGVYASVSIAQLDLDTRVTVLTSVKKWYGEHSVAPTYQRVSKYVRDLGKASRKAKSENKVTKMRAYIRVCQDLLKKHKIMIPKETWK
jgi:chromosomal replication initiation ATPase DnaA